MAFLAASDKALKFLHTKLTSKEYQHQHQDIAFYFKGITALFLGGYTTHATSLLDYVKHTFLQPNGDIISPNLENGKKSANEAYNEFWCYVNGWVAMAAQRMGRFDVATPVFNYMKTFAHPSLGGSTLKGPFNEAGGNICDVLSSSHLGLAALYFGDTNLAVSCGKFVTDIIQKQNEEGKFYLRVDDSGVLVKDFPAEAAIFHVVSATEPNQAFFMLGYPMAFLVKLYQFTGNKSYTNAAEEIFEFCSCCHESIYSFHLAHKVAWGASLLASVCESDAQRERYLQMSKRIADYLVSLQSEEGTLLKGSTEIDNIDQSSEISIWLREIACCMSL